ncbi:MAG TPA: ABC transporter permease [Firmicutes bacterium]|nr:ABC transporter permease [Bacillota bacterium]
MILFTVVPLGMVAYFAFFDQGQFTTAGITRIFSFMPNLLLSFKLALIATVVSLLLAYPFAYILSRKPERSRITYMMLMMLPMWMSFLLKTYAWMTLLEDTGIINNLLSALHLPTFHMINTEGAVILGMIYDFLPFMIMPLYTVMIKIDRSVIEAAQDLGANSAHILFRVVMPLSLPGIVSGVTMVFVPAVSTFYISQKLGGGKITLIGDIIESQFKQVYNFNFGSAMSLTLMILIFIVMGIMNHFDNEAIEGTLV